MLILCFFHQFVEKFASKWKQITAEGSWTLLMRVEIFNKFGKFSSSKETWNFIKSIVWKAFDSQKAFEIGQLFDHKKDFSRSFESFWVSKFHKIVCLKSFWACKSFWDWKIPWNFIKSLVWKAFNLTFLKIEVTNSTLKALKSEKSRT